MEQALVSTEELSRRGIDEYKWRALTTSVFPGAKPESILLAIDYCKARNLDPLKHPVHIVPMQVTNAQTGQKEWRDIIMPGINELRTTAARTGEYAGQDEPAFGTETDFKGVMAPELCTVTVYRLVKGNRVGFKHTIRFAEAVGIKSSDGKVNSMWTRRPWGQLAKCAEAGALRKAFPEEIGNDYTPEEMREKVIDMGTAEVVPEPVDEPQSKSKAEPQAESGTLKGDFLGDAPMKLIRAQLANREVTEKELCDHFKIETIDKFRTSQLQAIFEWINSPGP